MHASVVRSTVKETQFGLYTDAELRNLSVCKVVSPLARDSLGNALTGGLYDPRMGATSTGQMCPTCASHHISCPGHPGHIELDFPVYHPLLFPSLFQLVRSHCACCHRLRMGKARLWPYLAKLQLLEMGDVHGAETLDDRLLPMTDVLPRSDDKTESSLGSETVSSTGKKSAAEVASAKEKAARDVEKVLESVNKKYRAFAGIPDAASTRPFSAQAKKLQRAVTAELSRELAKVKKCENCQEYSPALRKDGYSKIFAKALPQRYARRSGRNSTLYGKRTALEEVRHEAARKARRQQRLDSGMDVEDSDADADEALAVSVDGTLQAGSDEEEGGEALMFSDSDDSDVDSDLEDDADRKSKGSQAAKAKAKTKAKGKQVAAVVPGAVEADKYLVPLEVEAIMQLLWQHHADILDFIWGRATRGDRACTTPNQQGWRLFFLRAILVAPNRFRPEAHIGDATSDHPQNAHLSKIIETNETIKRLALEHSGRGAADVEQSPSGGLRGLIANGGGGNGSSNSQQRQSVVEVLVNKSGRVEPSFLSKSIQLWIQLQTSVNCYMDSAKDPNPLGGNSAPAGIRQLLEKKEGIFRMNMMGKRVNYCCRSVISPDNFIGVNEIGIPVKFAKTLHYPTPVNEWNAKHLRMLVERGPHQYPGANQIETFDGKIIKLDKLSLAERVAKAKLLLATPGNKVYRHLINGDSLLVNRQPSLHKASIMAHKARVLTHVPEQTIRMHYANCSSYNADFDGDEMNCHFVQNELARAESSIIMNTDNQYIVPTSGNPLRGLIQDHVASGVKLTCKETFLNKADFMQLVYIATSGLEGTEVVSADKDIVLPVPAIFKPQQLWTGKQVVSTLLDNLIAPPLPPINLDGKTRTPPTAFGADQDEDKVIFRCNHLLRGVMDKAAMGATTLGIVHAVFELYGASMAGTLLHSFGCLFTYYLQDAGHTCGLEDLVLTEGAEKERLELMARVRMDASIGLQAFVKGENIADAVSAAGTGDALAEYGISDAEFTAAEKASADLFAKDPAQAKVKIDGAMQSVVNKSASDVIKACTPKGLYAPFLKNNFSMMVMTGAKGSSVNQSSISCMLGQQALEGQRVPLMVSGKSLPSFRPYDGNPRAHGFVADRFLTGVKPQEYYFHCMAGREGLVDTAVKTSRSGYLQRCLVKHLEELKVNYDNTVRDSGGNIIQFLYGDDGVDPMSSVLLAGSRAHMVFLARNYQALTHKYNVGPDLFKPGGLEYESARKHNTSMYYAKKYVDAKIEGAENNLAPTKKQLGKAVMHARRKMSPLLPWTRQNMRKTWESAAVTKVHTDDAKQPVSVDVRYLSDNVEEKRLPLRIFEKIKFLDSNKAEAMDEESVGRSNTAIPLLKAGLPDPSLSHFSLGKSLGSCSERVQDAIDTYVQENPDGLLVSADHEVPKEGDGSASINGDGLEMLIWMKYMQALACPGEAVGCVAAQSVGEPSTQMTLNTFHLAGHGGANVTLGIPRLREIVMTASRVLKTPTMTIPLQPHLSAKDCKLLARKVSELKLSQLLSHKGGVSVGEDVTREGLRWVRQYRIRLQFESPAKIQAAFDLTFDEITTCVKTSFKTALVRLVQSEQRKAGESTASAQSMHRDAGDFLSKGPTDAAAAKNRRSGDDDDDDAQARAQRGDDLESSDDDADEKDSDDDLANGDDTDKDSVSSDDEAELAPVPADSGAVSSSESSSNESDSDDEMHHKPSKASAKKLVSALKSSTTAAKTKDTAAKAKAAAATNAKAAKAAAPRISFADDKKRRSIKAVDGGVTSNAEEGWVQVVLVLPAKVRRLLMTQLAEKSTEMTKVRFTKGVNQCYNTTMETSDGKEAQALLTEGVNFEAMWELPPTVVDVTQIKSNDIYAVLCAYGVEAARESISNEIKGVFGVYGINVNPRHLSLIADFMTRNGSYVPMNRQGMGECSSPYVQMSFETTTQFLTRAAQEGLTDNQESPTSRIVLGQPMRHGTGCFDLMMPMAADGTQEKL